MTLKEKLYFKRKIRLFIEIVALITWYTFIGWLSINGAIEIYFTLFK